MNDMCKAGGGIIILVGIAFSSARGQGEALNARKELEAAARTIAFYGVDLNANPSPERLVFIRQNYARFAALLQRPYDRKDLIDLLKHEHPHVRTLAAFILTERGDAKALPFLVPLAKDNAFTFSGPHGETQTVGKLVEVMAWSLMSPAGDYTLDGDSFGRPGFKEYWNERKDRTHCASWFYLDLRGGGNTGMSVAIRPNPAAFKPVRARIDQLAEPNRTFTLLWLRNCVHAELDAIATDEELIAGCKKIGPENLVKLLRHEIPSDDPDMRSRNNNNFAYTGMKTFVLKHAKALLRAEDAEVLLECARRPDVSVGAHYAPWYVAAIELQPRNLKEILAKAQTEIEKYKAPADAYVPINVAKAVWASAGEETLEFTVNMFYLQAPRRGSPLDRRGEFVQKLNTKRPIDRKLVAAIVADKRLDTLDWQTLYQLAFVANSMQDLKLFENNFHAKASHPLGIYDYHWEKARALKDYPKETEALEKTLAVWRQTLRKAFATP